MLKNETRSNLKRFKQLLNLGVSTFSMLSVGGDEFKYLIYSIICFFFKFHIDFIRLVWLHRNIHAVVYSVQYSIFRPDIYKDYSLVHF